MRTKCAASQKFIAKTVAFVEISPIAVGVNCSIFVAVLILAAAVRASVGADMFVYFGTHRSGPNIGFSLAHFNTDTGVLTKPEFLQEAKAPAFFVIHPDGRRLYTVNSGKPGEVSAYTIEPHTGHLTLLNRQPAGGDDTSYVSLDQTGRYALAANYGGGSIAVFSLKSDGSLGDLGMDKVLIYRFNEKDGSLKANNPPFARIAPGSGPRHLKFHPNGRWVYLINEIVSTVAAFNWDATNGTLTELQTVSTLPDDFKGINTAAEIVVHPNGIFLYASNRGDDSLIVFGIDQATGQLTFIERVPSGGKTPRNFTFDPTGKWILCANHGSDTAVVFRVDETSGKLTQAGQPVPVPYPFCERFLPVR